MLDPNKKLFETRSYILGNEVTAYSPTNLIKVIQDVEAEIGRLEGINTESAHIAKRIKNLKADLKKVVAELDSRK